MPRRNMLDTFEAAKEVGPFDEYPVLPAGVDPQLHLSRNDRPQPFYLTCGKDCMLVQMSGQSKLTLKDTSVLYFNMVPGDYIYVPAGAAHRIVPIEPGIMYRYKAEKSGLEAVSFFCEDCDQLLLKETWDTADENPQSAYLRIVQGFNQTAMLRTCARCGSVHDPIQLNDYRWKAIAEELQGETLESAW